jgi:hypothetical protein
VHAVSEHVGFSTSDKSKCPCAPNLRNIVFFAIERARLDLQQNVRQHFFFGARRVSAHNRAVGLGRIGEIVLDNQAAERRKEQRRLVAGEG